MKQVAVQQWLCLTWGGGEVINILHTSSGGVSWVMWWKGPDEIWGQSLVFWSHRYLGWEASYTAQEKEICNTCAGVQEASEILGTEQPHKLVAQLPVLHWIPILTPGWQPVLCGDGNNGRNADWSIWVTHLSHQGQKRHHDIPNLFSSA